MPKKPPYQTQCCITTMFGKVFASVFIIFKTLSTDGKPIKYAKYANLPISRDIQVQNLPK